MKSWVLLLLVAAAARPATAPRAGYSDTIAKSSEFVRQFMKQQGLQGVSVALLDREEVVWEQGFGWADRDKAVPMTPETVFHVGSVSKMFATTAILILVDDGKVALDAPVVRYLPDFRLRSSGYGKITVRMLLNHQSGLPGAYYNWAATTAPVPDFNRRMLDWMAGEYVQNPPGYFAVYTNNGFDVAEKIVATVSGKSYLQFVRDRILTPLGMTRSGVDWLDPALEAALSKGYSANKEMAREYVNMMGTGGFSSTPADMCRLLAMFNGRGTAFGRTVLQPDTVEEMEKNETLNAKVRIEASEITPGLGWDLYADPALFHAGAAPTKGGDSLNFGTQILTIPGWYMGVAVMVNTPNSSLARTIAEQILTAAIEEKHEIAPPGPVKVLGRLDPGFDLHVLEGTYGSANYKMLWDLRTDGTSLELWARLGDRYTRIYDKLTHREDRWFASDDDSSTEIAVLSYGGRDVLLLRTNHGTFWGVTPIGERLQTAPDLSAAWKARLGKTWVAVDLGLVDYYFDTRALGLRLTERQGRLVYEKYAVKSTGRSSRDLLSARLHPAEADQVTDSSIPLEPIDDAHAWTPLQIDCRDLTHLQVITQGKEEWLRVGTGPSLWRPLDGIPEPDAAKPYLASIAPERAEWLKLPAGSQEYVLTAPESVHWALYNENLQPIFESWGGAWRLTQPAGSKDAALYLALYSMSAQQAMVQRLEGRTFSSASGVLRVAK